MEQKYKNWELIFWDNKSTDNSKKILQSKNDSRFKYFYSEDHTSLYKARNLAIEKTSGDYLTFLDTDDYWLPNKLMDQINLINESIDNYLKIGSIIELESYVMQKYLTPKLSIKRKLLINDFIVK